LTRKLKVLFINALIAVVVWGGFTLGFFTYLGGQGVGPLAGKVPGNGIYPLEGASYLAGEVCTINTPMDRSVDNMRTAFEQCARLHAEWQKSLGWEYSSE